MINYQPFIDELGQTALSHWQAPLKAQLEQLFADLNDGNLPRFLDQLRLLPDIPGSQFDAESVQLSHSEPLTAQQSEQLEAALKGLIPWRKGPFKFFDINVDAEWRCDQKWARIAPHLADLKHRCVLDVGSGNGYYGWRMKAAGARLVAGIDPSWLSVVQHLAVNHYAQDPSHVVLPLTLEAMVPDLSAFDTVFSMGVLYHRRSPLDHLAELRGALRPGGELVLETLVIEGNEREALVPPGRYARMNNVWFLPSPQALALWLEKSGFEAVRIVDLCQTTTYEQRTTAWKPGQSLADYLSPDNPSLTVEGLPAPKRATLIAQRPTKKQRLRRYQLE